MIKRKRNKLKTIKNGGRGTGGERRERKPNEPV